METQGTADAGTLSKTQSTGVPQWVRHKDYIGAPL